MRGARRRSSVEPEAEATPRANHLTAESIVHAALASLEGTAQQAAKLVALLAQHGIAHAWQLAALRDAELAELVVDGAGWNMGELMALRVALVRAPPLLPAACAAAADSDAPGPVPVLRRLLSMPDSASKPHMRAFSKGARTHNLMGFCAPLLAMPARQARASVLFVAEHTSNSSAVLAFVLWQFRVADDKAATASYASLPQITNFVIALGVLMLLFGYVTASSLTFFLGMVPGEILEAHESSREAAVRYMCMAVQLMAVGQYSLVAGVTLHAWGTLHMWYAVALTTVLALIWVKTAPMDKLMLTCLHPIGIMHAPGSLNATMDISLSSTVVNKAKAHRDTLHALAASAGVRV
eukprot:g1569.t1